MPTFTSNKDKKQKRQVHHWTLEEIFIENSKYTGSVAKAAIRFGVVEYKCRKCGNTEEYMGKPFSLEMHHINGNHYDNRIGNLEFLCPNYHTKTGNFSGRNKQYRN